ncbi:MAG: TolC family protein [Spirochaetaceae bacterium]|jgi:outer membrane protein TolC|nr:TolC family protein [Spirochaetaceae bacterium]
MKIKQILVWVCIFITGNVWAETTLDIESAVSLALEKNLSMERSRIESAAAKRKRDRSWNSLIPSLGAGAVAVHPTSITGPLSPETDAWTPGFSLSASLQLSPSIFTDIEQAKANYEAGLLNHAAARQSLEFQVRRLYYQLLLLRSNTELMEQNAASAQSRYEQISVSRRAGQASNLDELSARLDAQTQQTNVRSAMTAYENALDSLKQLLMIPPEESIVLQGSLQILPAVEQRAGSGVQGESLTVRALRKNINSLEAQRRGLRTSSYAPVLNLSWNAAPLYSDAIDDWLDSGGQFSVTLSMKPDNFLPWSPAKERLDSLGDSIAIQQSQLRENILSQENTVRNLRRNITQSAENIETLRLNLTLAEETREMYEESYRRGAADLQNVYSARDAVLLAENRLLSEQYNLAQAILELETELDLPFGTLMRWEHPAN